MSTAPRVDDQPHRVLVYRADAQLIEVGGGLVSDVLAAGGAAVVLATAAHLRDLEQWVRLCGADIEAAAAEHRYHRFSIETVSAWLERDVNPACTLEVRLREVLDQIPSELAPVVIFAELAAALWERGQVNAALSLEGVSNALRATRSMSVLCACPENVLVATADLERACAQHTAVLDPPAFPGSPHEMSTAVASSAALPPAPAACRTARQLVRAALARDGTAKLINTAELVVGELAANAVRHAGSTFTAEVWLSDDAVRLAVTDAAPLPTGWNGFPVARDHGLGVVAALASNWGVRPLVGGKVVWADVAREGA